MVAIVLFYVLTIGELLNTVLFPTHPVTSWLMLSSAASTTHSLRLARAQDKKVSYVWLLAARRAHAQHQEVLKELYAYSQSQISPFSESELVYEITASDPADSDNKSKLFEYYLKNQMIDVFYRDLYKWGADAMDEEWTPKLYIVGYDFLKRNDPERALVFWQWAAWLSPSWSHMWIEYATLLQSLGRHEEAVRALKKCSKDIYAGAHCLDLLEDFKMNDPPPLGFYNAIIRGDLHEK